MKLLYITSLSGKRINGFMRSAIIAAKKMGFEFTMACNMDMADKAGYEQDCLDYGIETIHIDFDRNPLAKKNHEAYKQLLQHMQEKKYDIVHCNTPIGGVLGRLCAKKARIPFVIYMAHGFHFWKGAPIRNWAFYYPVERFLAHYTDLLITINREDYKRANSFALKNGGKVEHVHGVGININSINEVTNTRQEVREELEIPDNAKVLITVGEVETRKNQIQIIRSMELCKDKDLYLMICGTGSQFDNLKKQIAESIVSDKVRLLGFRHDIYRLLKASDVFVFPSYQEGLAIALMEAMASKLPCVASRIRGNTDLLGDDYAYYFDPRDPQQLAEKIEMALEDQVCGERCYINVQKYDIENVIKEFVEIYDYSSKRIIN